MSGIVGGINLRSSGLVNTSSATDGQIYTGTGAGLPVGFEAAATVAGLPSGSMLDYGGASEPSGWVFCDGSAFNSTSDTTFADLYTAIGNTFGGSDGTDFQVPDFRGRVTIGKDNLGGSSANVMTHANADTLGGKSGAETHALVTGELASHTHTGPSHTHTGRSHTHSGPSHTHAIALGVYGGTDNMTSRTHTALTTFPTLAGGTGATGASGTGTTSSSGTGTSGSNGSGTAHRNDQPWMAITKIIKK